MKYLIICMLLCCFSVLVAAQSNVTFNIKTNEKVPLPGASLTWVEQNQSYVADSAGNVTIQNITDGVQTFQISFVGYGNKTVKYTFPINEMSPVEIVLERSEEAHEEEEVRVMATRTSRTITNTPTRIEVISGEELEEKGNMKPGDIRMLLNESTGIQTQQTSATSYNSSIRIQGLDGRYTQMLRDGYPLYAGFSGGLSIMQIAPLDLQQVEVIKGSASTLYGGGAIAGLVNLVSKTPGEERDLSFMANATSARGLDLSGFYSQKWRKAGLTVFGSRNTAAAYDPADIGLTAIPKFTRYSVNPRLFLYGQNTTADVGISFITEERVGGSMDFIKNGSPSYYEENNTDRFTAQMGIQHRLSDNAQLHFKNSFTRFNRTIAIPSYAFQGLQQSSYSELTYSLEKENLQWIAGANLLTDGFKEQATNQPRNYNYNTYGVFIQNTWTPFEKLTLESGLRGDYVNEYGFELLPRISAMVKLSPKVTTRIGGGSGYKVPTIFTEDAERIQFRNILPLDVKASNNERSLGGNWDVNYQTNLGEVGFSFNHLFFYTRLYRPLILTNTGNEFSFENSDGHIDTKGTETNIKLTYGNFKLFVGYTFADVNTKTNGVKTWLPLTARHRVNNVLMYEIEEKLKIGLEAYYVSEQQLNNGSRGKPYWITGLMVEKLWEAFSLFINFENFTDTRQTRFDTIYTGTINNPIFRDIYAPVDGFVINGGFKIKL